MADKVSILLEVVDKASPELQRFNENLKNTETRMRDFGVGLAKLGATIGMAAVGAMALLTKSSIDYADQLDETSKKVGVSVEELSALQYAAKLSGVSFEQLQTGLKKLSVAMTESQDPASEMANAFNTLGIKTTDVGGKLKPTDKVLAEIAERFKNAPDGIGKTAIAMQIFGKSGADLIPMLNEGKEGLAKLKKEAEKLGVVIDSETAKAAGDFNDSLDKLAFASRGVGLSLAKELTPTLNVIAESFVDSRKKGSDYQLFMSGLGMVFREVVKTASSVAGAVVALGKGIAALAYSATLAAKGDFGAIADVWRDWKAEVDASAEANEKFKKSIDDSANVTTKSKKATEDDNKEKQKAIEYRKGNAAAAEREEKAFQRALEALLKEADGYKQLTAVEQMNIQTTTGGYKDFTPLHKKRLLEVAAEIDQNRIRDTTNKAAIESQLKFDSAIRDTNTSTAELGQYLQNVRDYGTQSADAIRAGSAALRPYIDEIQQLQGQLSMAQAAGETKKAQELIAQIAAKQAALDSNLERVYSNAKEKTAEAQRYNNELNTWRELVGGIKDQQELLNQKEQDTFKWLTEGKITAQEFAVAMQKIDSQKIDLAKQSMSEFDKQMASAALKFQDYIGSSFYDMMQGQFDWTLSGFKKMLDQMVAQAMARQVISALFGDVSRTGQVSSGSAGAGLLASFISMLGFRENGGNVTAGQPYIVGEKRAELFIPSTNGTIIPDVSNLQSAGSNQLNLTITAMDSADVLRSLDKIKRPLVEMLNGTNRTYNLGVR